MVSSGGTMYLSAYLTPNENIFDCHRVGIVRTPEAFRIRYWWQTQLKLNIIIMRKFMDRQLRSDFCTKQNGDGQQANRSIGDLGSKKCGKWYEVFKNSMAHSQWDLHNWTSWMLPTHSLHTTEMLLFIPGCGLLLTALSFISLQCQFTSLDLCLLYYVANTIYFGFQALDSEAAKFLYNQKLYN